MNFKDDLHLIYKSRAPFIDPLVPSGTRVGPMNLPVSYRRNRLPISEVNFPYFRKILGDRISDN